MPIGLYLHIPFCVKKCAYCDFASYEYDAKSWAAVEAAMRAEMTRASGLSIGTVFVGGGTPTLLPAEALCSLLSAVRACFALESDAEITIEGNPGTADRAKLAALRAAGFNRLSLGAQAAQPHLLKSLERIHLWADVEAAVCAARDVGFDNISLDLMYGLPGQTPRHFRETMDAALSLSPDHLSVYSLIVEEGTPFYSRYAEHPERLPDEDMTCEMADDAAWMASDAGLERYEISNYAKPGRECRHNLGYWLRKDYLGIGCAAHSLVKNYRWANARTIDGYLAGRRDEAAAVADEDARFERLMLGLRLVQGIPWEEQALFDQYREKLGKLRERGLVDWNEARIWPTKRGLDLQNRVLVELMA